VFENATLIAFYHCLLLARLSSEQLKSSLTSAKNISNHSLSGKGIELCTSGDHAHPYVVGPIERLNPLMTAAFVS
jgi:hypothetical protein